MIMEKTVKRILLLVSLTVCVLYVLSGCKSDADKKYLAAEAVFLAENVEAVPDGAVISSEEDLSALSQNYGELAHCLQQKLTGNYFESKSFLLVNFYHSSSEGNIAFSSAYTENGILNLVFDMESPELVNMDYLAKPFVLSIDKISGIEKFAIKTDNLLRNDRIGGFNHSARDLKYY